MAKHIGIVACSAEGAALCYRTICSEGAARMGPHTHPEITMHTHPLSRYMANIEAGNWRAVADLMADSARRLAGRLWITFARGFLRPVNTLFCPSGTQKRPWR